MHTTGSFAGVTIYFLCVISTAVTYPTMSTIQYRVMRDTPPRKCCVAGYAFNEDLECVHVKPDRLSYMMGDTRIQQVLRRENDERHVGVGQVSFELERGPRRCSGVDADDDHEKWTPTWRTSSSASSSWRSTCPCRSLLGYCDLCECPMTDNLAVFLWIVLQYFTNATGFWLNVVCFDMTLSITKFRWMMGSGRRTSREENRRLLFYSLFAWGGALIPAIVALILEYCPGIPEDFPLKPNYRRYLGGPNIVVNLYFFGIPLLTLFWNNVLFVFTTCLWAHRGSSARCSHASTI